MIINTIYVVAITLLIAVPIGVCCAVYLTQYAKKGPACESNPFCNRGTLRHPIHHFRLVWLRSFCISFQLQYSILAGCLTMAICILPTIVRTTEEALIAVPQGYLEGAMALGASKLRVIFSILLPCAMPGIATAIVLAMGRIVGETAALLFSRWAYQDFACQRNSSVISWAKAARSPSSFTPRRWRRAIRFPSPMPQQRCC